MSIVLTTKIGSGQIVDEKTNVVSDWAKVYGLETRLSDSDMFTGFTEIHYNIVDPATGKPSIALAQTIKAKFKAMNPKGPVPMKFELTQISKGKTATLAVCGLAD